MQIAVRYGPFEARKIIEWYAVTYKNPESSESTQWSPQEVEIAASRLWVDIRPSIACCTVTHSNSSVAGTTGQLLTSLPPSF